LWKRDRFASGGGIDVQLLADKAVVVTGAGSGVGRASALLFAQHGARVVCADLRVEWAEETVRQVEGASGTAVAVACDVVRPPDVEAAVETAVDAYGRLDVMFNNAGIASPRRGILLEEHSDADFDRLMDVNTRGVFNGCRTAVLRFKEQGDGGVVVNTASVAGMVSWGSAVYGGTKAFVIQLTRALAIEGAPFGIRANCICPGGMFTNFGLGEGEEAFRARTAEELEMIKGMHPLGLQITPEDCAEAALYLASDRATNVTGVALPVDGGYLAR
jgi:NAD(P)-dependent dehydrogenase (short-subunit alcohol dehydrogenase family)